MRRVGKNVYTEIYFWGCNPSFVETSDGYVMIDSPQQPRDALGWRERMEDKAPIRYLINTEWHGDHIVGNAYFPNVEVIGQRQLSEEFEAHIFSPMSPTLEDKIARMKETDPDSVWLLGHPDYPLVNGPKRVFDETLTLNLGNHTFNCIHMPGHTHPQTSVHVPEEGVVFTGDNVFCGCKTFIQEGDPWLWLDSLKAIEALDVDVIIPGHGEPCTKAYLQKQGEIIQNWLGLVERSIERGMTEDEAATQPLDVERNLDPYPIGQRLFAMSAPLNQRNIRNIYKQMVARKAAGQPTA
jgi:glyoxylase-like metal-dependent hydrolase (beta-lactamase superfamily II)